MKLFELRRTEDESGISGTGTVAQGVIFDNGTCVLTWLTEYTSVAVYANVETVIKIHGHGGKTKMVQIADCDRERVNPIWDSDAHGVYPTPEWLHLFAEKDLGDENLPACPRCGRLTNDFVDADPPHCECTHIDDDKEWLLFCASNTPCGATPQCRSTLPAVTADKGLRCPHCKRAKYPKEWLEKRIDND